MLLLLLLLPIRVSLWGYYRWLAEEQFQRSTTVVLLLIWLLPVPLEPTWQTVSVTSFSLFFFSYFWCSTHYAYHSSFLGSGHTGQPENQFIMYHFCFLFAFAESVSTLLNGYCLAFFLLLFSSFSNCEFRITAASERAIIIEVTNRFRASDSGAESLLVAATCSFLLANVSVLLPNGKLNGPVSEHHHRLCVHLCVLIGGTWSGENEKEKERVISPLGGSGGRITAFSLSPFSSFLISHSFDSSVVSLLLCTVCFVCLFVGAHNFTAAVAAAVVTVVLMNTPTTTTDNKEKWSRLKVVV